MLKFTFTCDAFFRRFGMLLFSIGGIIEGSFGIIGGIICGIGGNRLRPFTFWKLS